MFEYPEKYLHHTTVSSCSRPRVSSCSLSTQEILAREEALKKAAGVVVNDDFVTAVQRRLDEEARENFRTFSFSSANNS